MSGFLSVVWVGADAFANGDFVLFLSFSVPTSEVSDVEEGDCSPVTVEVDFPECLFVSVT